MTTNNNTHIMAAGMLIILMLAVQACNNSPAGTADAGGEPARQTATPEICQPVHLVTPPEPPTTHDSSLYDRDDIALASMHRAYSGSEWYEKNLLERPFTTNVMDYLPDIDIVSAELSRSEDWIFVSILMAGQSASGGMQGIYGIELDMDVDGRGDFLIYGATPADTIWSTKGVKVYQDTNKDVGGETPLDMDNYPGNGYDLTVFNEGCGDDPDTAWIRVSPSNANMIQLAFKQALINSNDIYLWNAWAGVPEMLDPSWFDYNDHFSLDIAGSSLLELTDYYPLKSFWGWDNTCRWIVGQKTPKGTEPGLCTYKTQPEKEGVCIPGPNNKCP